jgi:ectoine hydroxylase-related dioxygenase (phytanoyl-CoA dioxygenase family)
MSKMSKVQKDIMVDELMVKVMASQINKALEDCGYKPNRRNLEKVIDGDILKKIENNLRIFVEQELEYMINDAHQNSLELEELD